LAIKDLIKSHAKGRKGKRKFYSRSIAFTLEQIQWLKDAPVNASQLLRWLVEGAMTAGTFLDLANKCVAVMRMEKRIAYLELRLERGEEINNEIYEELKRKRRRAIASLIKPPDD